MTEEKKRILIIDDDVGILRVFSNILKQQGYLVDTAETGKEALEKLEKEKFDACLVDVKLPDIDGTELLQKMGNLDAVKIIITGFSSEEVGKRAADYGADDFLVKPIKAEELLATLRDRLV